MATEDNQGKEMKSAWHKIKRIFISIFIILVVLVGGYYLAKYRFSGIQKDNIAENIIVGHEGEVSTISEASVKKVFEISELSTADYTYNAIARAYEKDGVTIDYYVAYEGKVKVGIDFDKIQIEIYEEEKAILITIPEIEVQEKTVDPGTLEYIFKNKKSETETIHREAYELCQKDLEERVKQETELLSSAEKNTKTVVKALVEPWVEQIEPGYEVKVLLKGEHDK